MTTSEKLARASANQKWHVRLFKAESDQHQIRWVNGPDRGSAAAQVIGGEAEQVEARPDGGHLFRRGEWSALVYPSSLMRVGNMDGRGEFLTGS